MRELAIYDGRAFIGVVKVAADGKAVAFDRRNKRVGKFPSFEAARVALDKLEAPA
jgi:hypothetical protein